MAYNNTNMLRIAQIGAMNRPDFRQMPTLDLSGTVEKFFNAKDAAEQRELAEQKRTQLKAYADALKEQHPQDAARIEADPLAYAAMLDDNAKAERDQQYKMDFLKQQFGNSMALERMKNENAVGLAKLAAELKANAEGANIRNNPFAKAMVDKFAKDYGENIKKAQSTYDEYANADRLLDKIETGGIYAVPGLASAKATYNSDIAEFMAAQNKLIPTMRPTGSGSTSDKDMAIFAKATFGIDKPKEANRNIIRGRMAAAENERDYQQLMAQWISAGGNPVAFENEWNQYLEMNPIFSNENGQLNKSRVSGRKWFNQPVESAVEPNQDVKIQEALAAGYTIEEIQNYLNGGK